MLSPSRRQLSALLLTIALVPSFARAQTIVQSFDKLQGILKPQDLVIVIDNTGQETTGRVVQISATSLVVTLLRREDAGNGAVRWTTGEDRSFAEGNVSQVLRSDLSGHERTQVYGLPGPFQGLQRALQPGQTAVIIDNGGHKIVGKVAELSPSSLVIVTKETGKKMFAASDVTTIKRAGPIWDGAVKGGGIGLLTMWLALSGCYNCSNGQFAALGAGVGAAIGLGIDAAFGPKTVYRSAQQKRSIAFAPVLSKDRQGLQASIRF